MRATQYFHRGLLLGATQIKTKEIQRNTLKYFWSFQFFSQESIFKEGKTKTRKLFTRENTQQAKEEQRNLFRFSFNTTTN